MEEISYRDTPAPSFQICLMNSIILLTIGCHSCYSLQESTKISELDGSKKADVDLQTTPNYKIGSYIFL